MRRFIGPVVLLDLLLHNHANCEANGLGIVTKNLRYVTLVYMHTHVVRLGSWHCIRLSSSRVALLCKMDS
jgi:hypothetical protein